LVVVSVTLGFLVLVVAILVGPLVRWLLPQFTDGLGPARIYVVGAYFGMLVGVPARVVQVVGLNRHYLLVLMTAAAVELFAAIFLFDRTRDLEAVALASSVILAGLFVVVTLLCFRSLGYGVSAMARIVSASAAPVLPAVALLWLNWVR